MIVECPRCNARYRVDDNVAADEPTFKCSRCSHFFGHEAVAVVRAAKQAKDTPDEELPEPVVEAATPERSAPESAPTQATKPIAPPEPPPRRTPTRAARPEPDSLSLPFSSPRSREETSGDDLDLPADEQEFTLDAEEDPADSYALGATEPAADARPRFIRDEEEYRDAPARDRLRRPYLIFLGVLLLVFGNLALYLRNHPETAERFLASIPFAGRILVENRLLQSRVYLRDIEGVYQQIK
ncbi:MAG: zinc-ribbon domain-containing protein, partial [Candidatus Binatia bacterium]